MPPLEQQKTLLTWIGSADLKSQGTGDGPVAQLLASGWFSSVHYLFTGDNEAAATSLMGGLGNKYRIQLCPHNAGTLVPVDHAAIYDFVAPIWDQISREVNPEKIILNVTSGTPAMAAIMLYLGKTRGADTYSTREARHAAGGQRLVPVEWSFGPALRRPLADQPDDRIPGLSDYELSDLKKLAPSDLNILILGETGTGKSYLARQIHKLSARTGELQEISGAEFSDDQTMATSRLFGHIKGAFTGADKAADGAFREADGGTLFLDEVGELRPDMQSFLLKAVQEKQITPLGEKKSQPVNVRLITATNRDLLAEISANRFRSDLYYRLAEHVIHIKPVRDLPSKDLENLLLHLLNKISTTYGVAKNLNARTLELLLKYPWPGNIRQIEHVLKRLYLLSDGLEISERRAVVELKRPVPQAPGLTGLGPATDPYAKLPLSRAVDLYRLDRVEEALRLSKDRATAAKSLGLSPQTLNNYEKAGQTARNGGR
ncbi:MAG: sigma 54-interacting transcriptional regulator [Candidatus Adiutrix sp.]|jgi:transcriptional regulator with AAA-type ATPase domain|nr:sigma 54-interacting transcriptional regulator [Candidatus Adiutrix sp.]